jgi:crossover junction endodeoxyribonuclease RuvC
MPVYKTGVKNQREVDPIELIEMFNKYGNIKAIVLEKVHSMPAQGVTSSFNFGINFGILKGAIGSLNIKPTLVTPQAWKKHFKLIGKPKDDSRLLAQKLFPSSSLSRKKDCDRADALLLGLYYIQTNNC